jgi:hypothetical protein
MARYGWLITVVGLVVVLVLLIVSSGNLSNVEDDLEAAEQQVSSLSSQLAQAQTDKSQLQASLDEANDFLDAANAELADIQAVFPPRNFNSPSDLENWLADNNISEQPITETYADWYSSAMQLQRDALLDGFIISVDFDYDPEQDVIYIYCVTIINGTVWFWDPETDDIFSYTGFGLIP